MTGLFRKLNTLVKATINDALDINIKLPESAKRLDPRAEKDAKRLRKRINEAIDYEEKLQAKANDLRAEVQGISQRADEAVMAGQEDTARRLIEQQVRVQRQLDMAEADLREHQIVAQDLIRQVNEMEAAIADARRAETAAETVPPEDPVAAPTAESTEASQTDKSADKVNATIARFNTVMGQAQERMDKLRDQLRARSEMPTQPEATPPVDPVQEAVDKAEVDDDLAARRSRLSGPPKPGDK